MKRLKDGYLHMTENEFTKYGKVLDYKRYHVRPLLNGDVQIRKIRSDKGKRRNPETVRATISRPYLHKKPKHRLARWLSGILFMLTVANIISWNYMADPIANRTQIHGKVETMVLKPFEVTKAEAKSETVEDKIRNVFGKDAEWAIRCFKSESGLRANAIHVNRNRTTDVGLSQINVPTHCSKIGVKDVSTCIEKLKNPDTNLKVAKQIFDASGSKPWYGRSCN